MSATKPEKTLLPLGNRVVVRPIEAASETPGGIIVPDTVRDKPQEGEIVAVSSGLNNLEIPVGAHVLFGKYSGTPIKFGDEDLLIMREDELICRIL